MLLYGIIRSERASKGQGGEYLDIEIMDEERNVVATMKVRIGQKDLKDVTSIVIYHSPETTVDSFKDNSMKIKGNKQKGEKHPSSCDCYHCF